GGGLRRSVHDRNRQHESSWTHSTPLRLDATKKSGEPAAADSPDSSVSVAQTEDSDDPLEPAAASSFSTSSSSCLKFSVSMPSKVNSASRPSPSTSTLMVWPRPISLNRI